MTDKPSESKTGGDPCLFSYVWQSVFAACAVFIALAALTYQNLVVVVSLAATAFTVYTIPSSVTAKPRNVIGGTAVGLFFGSVFAFIPAESGLAALLVSAGAVGVAMFTMTVTNTEHPPAAGTTLAVVTAGYSHRLVVGVLIGVGIISMTHAVLRPYLRDLVLPPCGPGGDAT